ncbi:MAG: transcription elongation factor GreA [Clostridia bacterium]|jgi:transcription elongation factor GreA|nr:transcription elongation factor GreA [Clostridia bacterium]
MEKNIPLTQEFFDKLTEKLQKMMNEGRTKIEKEIKIAKEYGDLSENAEYSAAKDAQQQLEMEIATISDILLRAYPIDFSLVGIKKVSVGNLVTIYDYEFDEEVTYRIVSSVEASTAENKISVDSPLGKALLEHKKGEDVIFKTPGGDAKVKILNISK